MNSVKENLIFDKGNKYQEKFAPVSEKVLIGLNVIDNKKK